MSVNLLCVGIVYATFPLSPRQDLAIIDSVFSGGVRALSDPVLDPARQRCGQRLSLASLTPRPMSARALSTRHRENGVLALSKYIRLAVNDLSQPQKDLVAGWNLMS